MNGSPNTVDIDSSKEQIYSDKIIQNFKPFSGRTFVCKLLRRFWVRTCALFLAYLHFVKCNLFLS